MRKPAVSLLLLQQLPSPQKKTLHQITKPKFFHEVPGVNTRNFGSESGAWCQSIGMYNSRRTIFNSQYNTGITTAPNAVEGPSPARRCASGSTAKTRT